MPNTDTEEVGRWLARLEKKSHQHSYSRKREVFLNKEAMIDPEEKWKIMRRKNRMLPATL
jgi:hypothetical protein